MGDDKFDQALRSMDPAKRDFLKKLVLGTAFAVPIVASYSVRDLALAGPVGSGATTTTTTS